MIALELVSSILTRNGIFTTVGSVQKNVLSGKLRTTAVEGNKRRFFNSKYNYAIDESSFKEYLCECGFTEEEIYRML